MKTAAAFALGILFAGTIAVFFIHKETVRAATQEKNRATIDEATQILNWTSARRKLITDVEDMTARLNANLLGISDEAALTKWAQAERDKLNAGKMQVRVYFDASTWAALDEHENWVFAAFMGAKNANLVRSTTWPALPMPINSRNIHEYVR